MAAERWNSWSSPNATRGGMVPNLVPTPSRAMSSTPSRAQYSSPASRLAEGTSQMGGVGLVFYRDPGTPYLIVKDVVSEGPAFKSSLIYPGDKLCCINDFDLSWSGSTPRSQQPQLPGPHGTAVTLTFDRSTDSAYPERFTITLIRSQGFYPDRLSSSPYRQVTDTDTASTTARQADSARRPVSTSAIDDAAKAFARAPPAAIPPRDAVPSKRVQPPVSQGSLVSQPQQIPQAVQSDYPPLVSVAAKPAVSAALPAGNLPEPSRPYSGYSGWDARSDPGSAGSQEDLDDLIQEIARKDKVLDLQSKLSAVELEHEKQIKDFQKNQAVLEDLVRNLRSEVDANRNKASSLEQQLSRENSAEKISEYEDKIRELQAQLSKERAQWNATEKRITAERDRALEQVNGFEERVRKQLRDMEAELERERLLRHQMERSKAPQHNMDLSMLRQIQTEKELLEAQNEDLRRELMEMKIHFSEAQQATQSNLLSALAQPHSPAVHAPPHAPHAETTPDSNSSSVMMNSGWEVPGLQLPHTSERHASPPDANKDVELHQSPSSARVSRDSHPDPPDAAPSAPSHTTALNGAPGPTRPARVAPAPAASPARAIVPLATAAAAFPNHPNGAPAPAGFNDPEHSASARAAAPAPEDATPFSGSGQPPVHQLHAAPPPVQAPQTASIPPMAAASDPAEDRVRHPEPPPPATTPIRAGIGMSFHEDSVTGRYIVTDVHPHGPAGKAVAQGMMSIGDALLAVNGATTQGRSIPNIVDGILGHEGTPVQLTIARTHHGELLAQQFVVTLIRSRPQTHQHASPSIQPAQQSAPASAHSSARPSSARRPPSPQASISSLGPSQPPDSAEKVLLPPGWVVEVDPTTGRTYYVNHSLKTFSWARPGSVATSEPNGRR